MTTKKQLFLSCMALALCFTAYSQTYERKERRPGDSDYEALVRLRAAQFHENFTAGKFDDNGPLTTEDIYVNSNGVIVVGRDKFVGRLSRYQGPFPGLAVNDRIMIVDGNTVAFHYIMQAVQKGKFGDLEPTGNLVEAMSAEFFTMNDEGTQMKDLITCSQVDKFHATASGEEKIKEHQKVVLYQIDYRIPREMSRNAALMYMRHFNFRNWDAMKALLADDVEANWNSDKVKGKDAVIKKMQERLTPFPDLNFELERKAAEGNRAAIGYTLHGTHDGVFTYKGKSYKPTGKEVHTRETQFFEVTEEGKIKSIITISDQGAFLKFINPEKK